MQGWTAPRCKAARVPLPGRAASAGAMREPPAAGSSGERKRHCLSTLPSCRLFRNHPPLQTRSRGEPSPHAPAAAAALATPRLPRPLSSYLLVPEIPTCQSCAFPPAERSLLAPVLFSSAACHSSFSQSFSFSCSFFPFFPPVPYQSPVSGWRGACSLRPQLRPPLSQRHNLSQ